MYQDVPRDILDQLKGEAVDFIVQSEHNYAKRKLGQIFMTVAVAFSGFLLFPIMFSIPLLSLYTTGSTQITVNGTLQTFTPANPTIPILFALFPNIIVIVALFPVWFMFRKALKYMRTKGAWYAGTNSHLIEFDDNTVNYYKWSEFENTIQTKKNNGSLDIILQFKKDHSYMQSDEGNKDTNMNIIINGKQIDFSKLNIFHNKVGLLGIKNGDLICDMIRHNMRDIII